MRARAALCLLLGACSGEVRRAGEPQSLSGSSLLLVTLDTTRADALGCYGGPLWSSPRLDALARAGVRFDQARCTSPVTLPSHSTILTGTLPFEHGVRDNATFRLPGGARTLAERLGERGYATAAVVGAIVLHSDFGLAQGFDVYSDVPREKLEMDVVEDQRTAGEVVDAALALLDSGQLAAPFFLWVHVFDPHRPLEPPEPFRARALEGLSLDTPYAVLERRLYWAELAYADAEIGRLIDGLGQRLPGEELLVACVADHGEAFGEHGEQTHGLLVYDTTMRVPLLLQHPRLPAGLVVERAVSTADLAPTLLGLLGIAAEGMSGRDLGPLLVDPGATLAGSAPVYLETCHSLYSYGWSPLFALVDVQGDQGDQGGRGGREKVIDGPNPAVFDLATDPAEEHNLVDERPEALARAREVFRGLASATRPPERIQLGEADRAALESLGYAGTAADGGRTAALAPGALDARLADPALEMQVKELCQQAVGHLAEGDHARAVAEIRRVLEHDPDNPIYLTHAGTILITAKMHAEARDVLERSLELREDASARCSLAVAHNLLGDPEAAIEVLRANARLHPHHLHTRFALGELLLAHGDPAEALEHFEAFLAEHSVQDPWHRTAETLAGRAAEAAAAARTGDPR
jgi:arylsulfatase A-like enzyme/Flp pilus assembly protein TadD